MGDFWQGLVIGLIVSLLVCRAIWIWDEVKKSKLADIRDIIIGDATMNEFDTLEKEVCCETCKYLDTEYGICRHPIAIRDDVGEKDSCNLWWGVTK